MRHLPRPIVDKFTATFAGTKKVGFSGREITEYFSSYSHLVKLYDHYGIKLKKTELFVESLYQLAPKYQYYSLNDLTWEEKECSYAYPGEEVLLELRKELHDFIGNDTIGLRFSAIRETEFRVDWMACQTRLHSGDAAAAITSARTLIETLLKTIIHERGGNSDTSGDLGKLLRLCEKTLNFKPSSDPEEHKIFSGLSSVISGIATISNKAGDRHGTIGGKSIDDPYFAQLCINAAGTIGIAFIEMHLIGKQS
jgi:hypothetical protein